MKLGRSKMLLRIAGRSIFLRPGKMFYALCALTVGSTLASAFLSLYYDIPRKMSAEFKTLGPNLIIAPTTAPATASGGTLPSQLYVQVTAVAPHAVALPWLYAVGKIQGRDVILGGTEFSHAARAHPGWLTSVPLTQVGKSAVAGKAAAENLGWHSRKEIEIAYGGASLRLPLAGTVSTGGSEDSQVLLPLATLQQLTRRTGQLSMIEVAVPGSADEIEETARRIRGALQSRGANAEVRPLRPVIESQGRVVLKVQWLMLGLTAVVFGLVVLTVLTTISALILDRRSDIGLMKALGGSDGAIAALFLAEATFLACLASALGYGAGYGLARWAAFKMFQTAVSLRADVLGAEAGITLAAALLATAVPARWIPRMEPAEILRGE